MCTVSRTEKDFLYVSNKGTTALPARKEPRTQQATRKKSSSGTKQDPNG